MIYQRGNPLDYDRLAELSGDDGWKYKNMLPHFKNSENYNGNFHRSKLRIDLFAFQLIILNVVILNVQTVVIMGYNENLVCAHLHSVAHIHVICTSVGTFHGRSGPQHVSKLKSTYLSNHFVNAAKEFGYEEKDLNAEQTDGM